MGGTHRGGHGLWLTHLKNDLKTLKVWGEKTQSIPSSPYQLLKKVGILMWAFYFPPKLVFLKINMSEIEYPFVH